MNLIVRHTVTQSLILSVRRLFVCLIVCFAYLSITQILLANLMCVFGNDHTLLKISNELYVLIVITS